MADPAPTPARTRNSVRIVLFISLALNLVILGMVAGSILGGGGPRGDRALALRDIGYGPFVAALPREDRRDLGRAMVREAGAFRQNREQMRASFEAILDALRADPYDPAALERLVSDQQSRIFERQELGRALLLERIANMDAAGRGAYADALDQALRRGPRGRDRARRN